MDNQKAVWDRGDFSVAAVGAMCAPASFRLDDGRTIQPFAIAPWSDNPEGDPRYDELPPLLKRLRGDWACIPFGMPEARPDLPSAWVGNQVDTESLRQYFHGPSANLPFKLERADGGCLEFRLDFPEDHPIAWVRRVIGGVPGKAMLEFTLEIMPRETIALPIGVHPVFRLPDAVGAAELDVGGEAIKVYTYPVDAEPGVSKLAHGGVFESLQAARDKNGAPMDLSRHPLAVVTEEVVLVGHADGHARLTNRADRYRVDLHWEAKDFPSCNLWISNRGRTAFPWNGRHCALGIEPVAAPWDLGVAVARNEASPLRAAGVRTATDFTGGVLWKTSYSIEVSSL
ncbi:hypothetical protein [Devosia sp.]|jgi:hypothetical protein|uniref:hypothetical protein n=1 Tax=Devosia sp. TaxID=1871048 RepID=UPI0037BE48C2